MRIAEGEVKQATVLGYGRTGRAVASYLHDHGVRVFISDNAALSDVDRGSLEKLGIAFEEGGHTFQAIENSDLIVLSPGIRLDIPILQEARLRSIRIISEIDLAYLLTRNVKIIAITGTNGKSTTVKLIEGILLQRGIRAIAAGNIGLPFITLADDPPDVVVLEVSSFQLEQSNALHPHVACLLNITPDHLDRHGSFSRYIAAKASIFKQQLPSDMAVVPHDLPFSTAELSARVVYLEDIPLPHDEFIARLAPHNRSNLRAAIACSREIIPTLSIDQIDFAPLENAFHLPYRMQEEPVLNGVRVINDSKSTNAASTITALEAIDGPCVLILGGRHKGAGYDALARVIAKRDVRNVILFGEGAPLLRSSLRDVGYARTGLCFTLAQALTLARQEAREGDTILFSPACSSYDQYRNYVERGEHFSRLVRSASGQVSFN